MTSSDISLISLSNIKNISIQTSQKISSKYITKFIQTSLQLNDIILIENDKVFFSYIKESSIYEIYILNSKSPNISIESKIFDYTTIRLLHTAQKTNTLEQILQDIINIYNEKLYKNIKYFSLILEPVLIFIIASIVLWLVLAIMTPIWDLSSLLK